MMGTEGQTQLVSVPHKTHRRTNTEAREAEVADVFMSINSVKEQTK